MRIGFAVVVACATLVVACGSADSRGDEVLAGAAPRSAWRLDSTPRLTSTPVDAWQAGDVLGLTVLPDGGVAVANGQGNTIAWLDANGRVTKSVGRRGRGPGEFDGIWRFYRYGDTIAVEDSPGATQLFSVDGAYVRTQARLERAGNVRGYFANGDRVFGTLNTDSIPEKRWEHAMEALARIRDTTAAVLGAFPSQMVTRDAKGSLEFRLYSPRTQVALLRDGFCAGNPLSATFSCFDGAGRLLSTVTLSQERSVAVSEMDRDAYFADFRASVRGRPAAEVDEVIRRMRERVQFADSLGAYGRLMASRDDLVWVGPPSMLEWLQVDTRRPADATSRWSVFSPGGEWLSDVMLPAGFALFEAGADYVAGLARDGDGNDVVTVYPLVK